MRGRHGSPDTKEEGALSKHRSSPVLVQNGISLRVQHDWAAGAWLDAASWPRALFLHTSLACVQLSGVKAPRGGEGGPGKNLDCGQQGWAVSLTCCGVSGQVASPF